MPEPNFFLKVGDRLPPITRTLRDANSQPVDISNTTVQFKLKAIGGGAVLGGAATITSASGGAVSYSWQTADTAAAGLYLGEWEVTFSGGSIETFPNSGYDLIMITADLR
jgi:hypothetical protein